MKKVLRDRLLKKRKSMDLSLWAQASQEIQRILLESSLYQESKSVMLYSSFRNEVNTSIVFDNALREGKVVVFPRVENDQEMTARRVSDPEELVRGSYGILEPSQDAEIIDSIDLVVVPGVAFDRLGYRLGYGAGYYDRFLKKSSVRYSLGMAFEFQVLEQLPRDEHDERLDYLVTEKAIVSFS